MSNSSSSNAVPTSSGGLALITGASSGIGAEFARKLAARGHNLVLVGRRKERLEAVAGEVRQRFGVDAEVVVADLADQNQLERLEGIIDQRGAFDFLVNNAGFGTTGRFAAVEREKHLAMLRVHAEAMVRFTHAVLPAMKTAGRGTIINVSSVAGLLKLPGSTLYVATKAFINSFSESLALEVRRYGVRVQALCPGFTVTEFHDREEFANWRRDSVPKMLWMDVGDVVDLSLEAVGRGPVVFVAGFRYKLFVLLARNRAISKMLRPLVRKREVGPVSNS